MAKTLYYTDQDFERFMARSEWQHKVQFRVWLVCSVIIQSGIFYVLLTDNQLTRALQLFLLVISIIAFICLVGLWYCWISTCRNRRAYQKMRQKQQEEAQTLLDEVEDNLQRKLNY